MADEALLDEKAYFVDVETATGGTALLLACASGNAILAEELLRLGAAIDYESQRGHTALTWACVCGSDRVVEMLLRHGASSSRATKLEGRSPLAHAAQHGHARVLQVLLDTLLAEAHAKRHAALCPAPDAHGARRASLGDEREVLSGLRSPCGQHIYISRD